MKLTYSIDKPCLVKEYLKEAGLSRTLLKKVRALDNIRINGEKGKNWYELKKGDILELEFDEKMNEDIKTCSKEEVDQLNILYEDEYFLVLVKRANLSSMPSIKHQEDNLLSVVKTYLESKNNDRTSEKMNMHLVNRLDYQTSGLIIISKSGIIQYDFSKQEIEKKYLCVVEGNVADEEGVLEYPISRYPLPEIRRYVDFEHGKNAKTVYKVLNRKNNQTLLDIHLLTGRTHQIRVHFSYIGYPLVGDKLYNTANTNEESQLLLHAYYLKLVHPVTKEVLEFKNYPDWYQDYQ